MKGEKRKALRHPGDGINCGTKAQRGRGASDGDGVYPNNCANVCFRKIGLFLLLATLVVSVAGCGDNDQKQPASLPTRGDLLVGIDESLKPFADAEIAVFTASYPDARITPLYLPEKEVVEKLLANEIQTAIICRNLYPEESEFLAGKYSHSARSFKLAEDEISLVVNKDNPIETISHDDLTKILSGKISDWEDITAAKQRAFGSPVEDTVGNTTRQPSRPAVQPSGIIASQHPRIPASQTIIVVLTASSSIDRFFSSSDSLSPASAYALDTTADVIDYVKNNVSALGVVGGSWFLQKGAHYADVRLLPYDNGNPETGSRQKSLKRDVYAVTHEPATGLGSGLISFMAGQKGQLILSKAGLIPYKPIERRVQLSDSFPEQ